MLAFWVEIPAPFWWIISKFFLVIGVFFPPEIFGEVGQQIITYSPIYATISGPAKLFVNFSWELFAQTLGLQVFYLVVFMAFGYYMYKKGTKKVNVYGG